MALKKINYNEKQIYDYLYSKIKNHYGVCGLMGNLKAESNLRANNLQNSFEQRLGLKDDDYVTAVDENIYLNFVNDGAGFGLAQWTYWSRKNSFKNYCDSKNASIGCCETQLEFLIKELEGYSLLNSLKNAKSVRQASDIILLKFEKPADQSVKVQEKRASYGQEFYNKYATKEETKTNKCSNSPLIDGTLMSPNKTPMTNKVNKKIVIHHMAGVLSAKRCGEIFQNKSRKASSNYGIGKDGEVFLYVNEWERSWCSSSKNLDSQAITIETSNSMVGGNWPVSDKVYNRLIDLCVDICKRNNIKELTWTGDLNGSLVCHYMTASTSCPGPYLKSKMAEIAKEVTKRLNPTYKEPVLEDKEITYKVQKGDTLSKIAQKFNTTYISIQKLNNIKNPNLIYVGQELRIKTKGEKEETETYKTYKVQPGDSLWKIAKNELNNPNRYPELMTLNNLKTTTLQVGQVLKIPKK